MSLAEDIARWARIAQPAAERCGLPWNAETMKDMLFEMANCDPETQPSPTEIAHRVLLKRMCSKMD